MAEFARISDPLQRTYRGRKRWVDVYADDSKITGEYGSVVVHNRRDWGISFIAHHFIEQELRGLLENAGIDIIKNERIWVKSRVSGRLRETLNMWGLKK